MTNAISTAPRQLAYYCIRRAAALLHFKVSIPQRRRTDCAALSCYFQQPAAACLCTVLFAFLHSRSKTKAERYTKDNTGGRAEKMVKKNIDRDVGSRCILSTGGFQARSVPGAERSGGTGQLIAVSVGTAVTASSCSCHRVPTLDVPLSCSISSQPVPAAGQPSTGPSLPRGSPCLGRQRSRCSHPAPLLRAPPSPGGAFVPAQLFVFSAADENIHYLVSCRGAGSSDLHFHS